MSTLGDRARANADERDGGSWGYRVQVEPGEAPWEGRYRGVDMATGGEYGDQTIFLFWDDAGAECYMRGHASLVAKIEGAEPSVGDSIAVYRKEDYTTSGGNSGYAYGVACEPNGDPLPEGPPEWADVDEPEW